MSIASDCINEGDTILLYCPEASGFLFSQPPSSSYSYVTIFPVERIHSFRDPAFSNIHYASFQVLPEHAVVESSPLNPPKENSKGFVRSLVYGRKVKLLHVASQKYLSLAPTVNSSNITTTLVEQSDADSLFRILPARAGKHRGEDVLSDDHIKLECVRQKGHHLLCSKNALDSKTELKLAIIDSIFIIYRTNNNRNIPSKAVRGGSVVLIFNVKQESYISGKGSILTDSLPDAVKEEIVTEVGAKKRESTHGIQRAPPLSGDCFWQLEKSANPLCGDQFQYGEKCRIKHIPTQHYLAYNEDHRQISLKKLQPGHGQDPEINFSLLPLRGEAGGVLKGSYVQLRHVQTGKNLIVQGRYFFQCAISDPSAEATTKSKYYQLGLEDSDPEHQQFFRLEEIPEDIIHEFYQVSGIVATLREHIEKFVVRDESMIVNPDLSEPLKVLDYLYLWLSEMKSANIKSKANMLRVIQGIDLLVGFLYEIDQITKDGKIEDDQQLLLCKKICRVLHRYVETANRKSHLYIADERFMDILFNKIGCGIGVEHVLSTLVRDESDITEKVVNRLTSKDGRIEKIKSNLDAATLDFLSTLCFTNGRPVRSLQDIIRKSIIEDGQDTFFAAKIKDDKLCFVYPERLVGPVANIGYKDTAEDNEEDFKFYVAQLKLFSRVCKGINLDSIFEIVHVHEYITFKEAILILRDKNVHPLLQSAYLDFVISAFVDFNVEESGVDIDNIQHCYDWNGLNPDPVEGTDIGESFYDIPDPDEMKALTECIRGTLKDNSILYAKEEVVGHNEFLEQILSVLEPLVAYGFFKHSTEIRNAIEALLGIIDGRTDKPFKDAKGKKVVTYQKEDRFKSNEDNKKLFRVKTKAIKTLHLFFKHFCYVTNAKLIYQFKYLRDGHDDDSVLPNAELKTLLEETFDLNDHVYPQQQELQRLTNEPAYSYFYLSESDGKKLIKILLDLLKYDDNSLNLSTCRLLFDLYQQEDILFKDAKRSYLATESSAGVYREMVECGTFADRDKILLRIQQGSAVKDEYFEKTGYLEDISTLCTCVIFDDIAPHKCNQNIIFTSGVFSALTNYVLGYCSGSGSDRQQMILYKAIDLLIKTTHRNKIIQSALFEYFLDFLEARSAVASIAKLLTEIVSENVMLCRKLAEGDIRHIFKIASTSAHPDYCELYTTLIAVIKVSKISPLALKNYQELVSHMFSDYHNEYFGKMMRREGCKMRQNILRNHKDDDRQLVQLLSLSDLLAVTCEGESKYADDVCQGVFEIDELISILSDPLIMYERKKPFANLLCWAHLITERDSLVSVATLAKSKAFWEHIQECATLIAAIKETIQEDALRIPVGHIVQVLLTQFISIPAWKSMSQDVLKETLECGGINHEVPLNSFVLYILEGLVPLLYAFCKQLISHSSAGLSSKVYSGLLAPHVIEILLSIGKNMAGLILDEQQMFLSTQTHVIMWLNFFDSIIALIPDTDEAELLQLRRDAVSSSGPTNSVSQKELNYLSEFKNELKINKEFQWFVENYKSAYEGKIMALEANLLLSDSEDLTPSVSSLSFDLLPNSPSFRSLVARFDEVVVHLDEKSGKKRAHLVKVPHLLNLLIILYRQLQQPLTSLERGELNRMLLKCLQILSGVVHAHIDKLDARKQLQAKNPDEFVKEYEAEVEPIQNAMVAMNAHNKVMLHLSHPNDEVAVQVLGFLRAILYLGNESAQAKIGHLCSHKDTKFFQRVNKLLDIVVSNLGQPDSKKPLTHRQLSISSIDLDDLDLYSWGISTDDEYDFDDYDDDINDDGEDEGDIDLGEGSETQENVCDLNKQTDDEAPGSAQVAIEMEPISSLDQSSAAQDEDGEEDDENADDEEEEEFDFYIPRQRTIRRYKIEAAGQLEATEKEAKKHASVVLDVISSLCDGQNRRMQGIFHTQNFTFSNVNVVGQVAIFLQSLAEHIDGKNLKIIQKTIQALIELCAGNFSNQETAFKGQVVDSINLILKHLVEYYYLLQRSAKSQLQASCIELLEVMLEETNEKSPELAQGISEDLNIEVLLQTMVQLRPVSGDIESRQGMFRGFHVLRKIADYLSISVDSYVKPKVSFDSELEKLWNHVNEWTRSIEIKYRNNEDETEILTRVYFPFDPARELTTEQKEIVKKNIVRESPEDKVKDLLEWMEAIRKNIHHKNQVNKHWWSRWVFWFSDLRHFMLVFLTLFLNALVLFLFKVPNRAREFNNTSVLFVIEPNTPYWFHGVTLFVIGSIHLILSLWMVIEYFIEQMPNIIWVNSFLQKFIFKLKESCYRHKILRHCLQKIVSFKSINHPKDAKCFEIYFLSFAPLYRILFLLCSIAALGTHGYFYCGCILYVLVKNDVLYTVTTAVRRSASQLFSVLLLGLAVLFIYAVVTFFVLSEFFNPDDDGSYAYCSTLIECYISVIREGLLDTLGSGISLEYVGQPRPSFTVYWLRAAFDVSFFLIVTTLGLNIVIAILVDRFSELRSERDEVNKDKLNYCFICGIDNDTFERKAKGFRDHVINDHSKWNYIYFVLHLHSMFTNDHNALEKYVYDNIKSRQIGFFPLREAKVLKNEEKA